MSTPTVPATPPSPPEEAHKSVFFTHVYSDINAPVDKVWDVLTNVSKYHEWNTFVHKITVFDAATKEVFDPPVFEVGRTIRNEYHFPPTAEKPGTSIDRITVVSHDAHRLEWVLDSKVPVVGWTLLHTNRMQWLSLLEGGGTRYECCLTYHGPSLFLAMLKRYIGKNDQISLQAVADGLKSKSEQ